MMEIEAGDFPAAQLRSFLAVADLRSFSDAARRLSLRQSTVSQHVQRLERAVGRRLLQRDTHSVALTADGEAMRHLAGKLLAAHDGISRHFSGAAARERIRFGVSEDFAVEQLVDLLSTFQREHPLVDVELTIGLSAALYKCYDAGDLDVMFAKRRAGDRRGRVVWRERLMWIARPDYLLADDDVVPLIAYSPPSITRAAAIAALDRAKRRWRLACRSGSLNGLRAAALAGIGVAAHSARLIPTSLAPLANGGDLPPLEEVEFVVLSDRRPSVVAAGLIEALMAQAAASS